MLENNQWHNHLLFSVYNSFMKSTKILFVSAISFSILFGGCKSMNRTQKGAVIGTASGGVMGAVIGRAAGNTALGAIIGATVGGVTGAVIGRKMDKQAEEMRKKLPDAKVERVGEGIIVEFNEKILFGFDKSDLSPVSKKNLDKAISVLNKYPDTNIEVQGHTDSKGTEDYNMTLSEKRSRNVSGYLSQKGVSSNRLSTKGYGKNAPKYDNDTESGRAQNRRVEFLISANDKMKEDAKKESSK